VLPTRARLFALLALLAVAAVNVAGLLGIAVARRGAMEEAERLFASETESRARQLESRLSATRADLAFLAGSAPVQRLRAGDAAGGLQGEAAFRRQAAESALLLFLRAHPEVVRLTVRGPAGEPLLLTGRRGGVPVLWVATSPTGSEGAAQAPDRPLLLARLAFGEETGRGAAALEAELAATSLVAPDRLFMGQSGSSAACGLTDGSGRSLARGPVLEGGTRRFTAEASVTGEGWTPPPPWRLTCVRAAEEAVAGMEPLSSRYRTTLFLNLAVMALALLLGGFAVREALRRERSEARAHEEARVRELERQLFHAERLTTVGRLAAGIAHEINNPLEGMANYLGLLKDALSRGDVEASQRRLEGVRQGLDRAALVVRQVLAHAGPGRAPRTSFDLAQVLGETAEFVRSRGEFDRIRFETSLPVTPLVVKGSPIMIGQVATNLILNACEAQPEGGEVAVVARREGERVVAEVQDRGPGVPEAARQRIFEPFFSTKDSTGLGLSVCHSIVRDHGGDLVVVARDGGGAVFRMTLPVAAAGTEAAA
jgi:signal transduction histidine kinase